MHVVLLLSKCVSAMQVLVNKSVVLLMFVVVVIFGVV